MTSSLDLLKELRAASLDPTVGQSRRVQLFEHWFRQAVAEGRDPDSLETRIRNEEERFRAWTIQGPDLHLYWRGPSTFVRNDGRSRVPRRWLFEHETKIKLSRAIDVWPTCGEVNCIQPDHQESGRSERRLRYSREEMLGRLRVERLRLGHTPTLNEWDRRGLRPMREIVVRRFGSWERYCSEAGVPLPDAWRRYSREDALSALAYARERLGHFPTVDEYLALKDELRERGWPTTRETVRKLLGVVHWDEVRKTYADS